jgi:hypothetical protein
MRQERPDKFRTPCTRGNFTQSAEGEKAHALVSCALPIAGAEPIATEQRIKNADRASTLGSVT